MKPDVKLIILGMALRFFLCINHPCVREHLPQATQTLSRSKAEATSSLELAAMTMSHRRLFPMLLLLCISLLSILVVPSVSSSLLSFDIHFASWGYDPQEVLFHQTSPRNLSSHGSRERDVYTGHHDKVVLRRKKKKNFVPRTCDCSRFDGLMYARPAPLRDTATGEVASFKMTLCLRINRGEAGSSSSNGGVRTGLFLFLVPYPWNRGDTAIEVGLDSSCTGMDEPSLGSDPVVCAHVHYDAAEELLKTNIRVGDRSCLCMRRIDRGRMPNEAAVGFASTTAGDPIKLENVLTWAFHSTLEPKKKQDPPGLRPGAATGAESESSLGEQQVRLDPWNRNAELNFRYRRNWQQNWQLTCSISVSLSYGNANEGMD
ncbi:hypothetical protein GQ55_4G052700 [Panicum hallii var. hallii]|uniref:Legume lectin domain-containing protein n=1 Tax=Panicum hallii var. hallii TaxID=1504633 RepID=A0A2T7DVH1_9POAL|nr:hypothetical protein GQ55_4G052700 [Panicum hallii var. hallii]